MTIALRECPLAIHSTLLLGRLTRREAWLAKLILCEEAHEKPHRGRIRLEGKQLLVDPDLLEQPLTSLQETVPDCDLSPLVKADWLAYRLHIQLGYTADVGSLALLVETPQEVAEVVARAYHRYFGEEIETVRDLVNKIT